MCVRVCVCVCVLMWWVDSTMHRFIDAFVDSPIQTMPRFIPRFSNVSNGSDVVVLVSFSALFNLLRSCFVNLGVDFVVILSVSGSILISFWCPWESFGDPVPPRGPPKGAESKMWSKRWFVGPPRDPQRGPKIL